MSEDPKRAERDERDEREEVDGAAEGKPNDLRGVITRYPVASLLFVVCVAGGAALSYVLIGDDLSALRRIAGGALMGGIGYLLVMVGRLF